jgi:hypothetical protein
LVSGFALVLAEIILLIAIKVYMSKKKRDMHSKTRNQYLMDSCERETEEEGDQVAEKSDDPNNKQSPMKSRLKKISSYLDS